MGLIFVSMLIFGFQKIFLVKDQISQFDKLEIKKNIEDALSYCNDPLNKGNIKTININHKAFDGICVLSDDFQNSQGKYDYLASRFPDLVKVVDAGENVVLVKSKYTVQNDISDLIELMVIDSFKVDLYKGTNENKCWFSHETQEPGINMEFEC